MRFSDELITIIGYAREEAMRTGAYSIKNNHLMLAILRDESNPAAFVLKALGADTAELKLIIDSSSMCGRSIPFKDEDKITVSREAQNTMSLAVFEASLAARDEVTPEHLLLATLRATDSSYGRFLNSCGINRESVAAYMLDNGFIRLSRTSARSASDKIAEECSQILDKLEAVFRIKSGICS